MCRFLTFLRQTLKVTVLRSWGNLFVWTRTHVGESEKASQQTDKQALWANLHSRKYCIEVGGSAQVWSFLVIHRFLMLHLLTKLSGKKMCGPTALFFTTASEIEGENCQLPRRN